MFAAGVAALLVFQFLLVFSHQNCSVTRQPDDSFMYEFSEPHASTCDISWEDVNKTVIARNSRRDETLVQALTNRSIITKTCYDYLLQGKECLGVLEKIACSVNCTRLLEQSIKTTKSTTVNTTLNCCTDDRGLGWVVYVIILTLIIVAVIVVQRFYKLRCWRTGRETVLYSAPLELTNMNGNSSNV